jgi:Leucine-rich repeat (LRR) protein
LSQNPTEILVSNFLLSQNPTEILASNFLSQNPTEILVSNSLLSQNPTEILFSHFFGRQNATAILVSNFFEPKLNRDFSFELLKSKPYRYLSFEHFLNQNPTVFFQRFLSQKCTEILVSQLFLSPNPTEILVSSCFSAKTQHRGLGVALNHSEASKWCASVSCEAAPARGRPQALQRWSPAIAQVGGSLGTQVDSVAPCLCVCVCVRCVRLSPFWLKLGHQLAAMC